MFEALSYVVAFLIYLGLRRRFGDPIIAPLRWTAIAAAVAGAAFGSKLLFWLEDPPQTLQHLHDPAYLLGGKTIVGALIFGLVLVEIVKRSIRLRTSTGDLYAIPLAIGIAIGRIGCFLTGLSDNTYGNPTSLPWAINFGDGIPRHPTQLYEIVFLLALTPVLFYVLRKIAGQKSSVLLSGAGTKQSEVGAQSKDPASSAATTGLSENSPPITEQAARKQASRFIAGDAFKLFMVAYMTFRLFCDFVKPYPRIYLGLGGIQWACVLVLLYYVPDISRWLRGQMLQAVRG